MRTRFILLAAGALVALPACAATPRMSLEEAVSICTERAKRFAQVPYGRFAEEPPPERVAQDYRACVFANSGRYPAEPPRYRESVLTHLRDALKR